MDNRSHQESGWDMELLAPEMAELQALNVDASLTGFDADEISKFLDSTGSEGDPPDSFREYDETIPTEHQCPKCGYTWSGAAGPKPEGPSEDLAA
jgi:rubrerythrin